MTDQTFDADVLVVGFGPVGAALASLLSLAGVSAIAADRAADLHPLPRAVHFDAEIMRIFQGLGVAEALAPHIVEAPDYEFRTAGGEVLVNIPRQPRTPQGWASGYMFHQPGLERTLRDRAEQAPGVEIVLEAAFEGFTQDAAGVTTTLKGREGTRTVRSRFLVGCDGGWSPVREAAGLTLDDLQFDEPWLVVDVLLADKSRVPAVNLQVCDPARPTTCVHTGPGRHRWEFMLLPGETGDVAMAEGFVESLLEPWDLGSHARIERQAVYRFHGLVAHAWRQGRVLIAGDAAHQMPPMAGQGMCSGVRDAANLGWKLAAVIRGEADATILDSYQAERDPHVREVIGLAIGLGRVVCATDPEVAKVRDGQMIAARAAGAPPPAMAFSPFGQGLLLAGSPGAGELFVQPVTERDGRALRLDDVLGAGGWMISRRAAAGEGRSPVRPWSLEDAALAPFVGELAAWLDARGADAVLVRPDRVVFGTGEPERLAAAYGARIAGPRAKAA